jgi:hypothetical protein
LPFVALVVVVGGLLTRGRLAVGRAVLVAPLIVVAGGQLTCGLRLGSGFRVGSLVVVAM